MSADPELQQRAAVLADGMADEWLSRVRGYDDEVRSALVRAMVKSLVAALPASEARDLVRELAISTLRGRHGA